MSVTLGNPIVITSGTNNTLIGTESLKVSKIFWKQPTAGSTSSLIISKKIATGTTYLDLYSHTSGLDHTQDFDGGMWWRDPYLRMMPTGTLYIYTK